MENGYKARRELGKGRMVDGRYHVRDISTENGYET